MGSRGGCVVPVSIGMLLRVRIHSSNGVTEVPCSTSARMAWCFVVRRLRRCQRKAWCAGETCSGKGSAQGWGSNVEDSGARTKTPDAQPAPATAQWKQEKSVEWVDEVRREGMSAIDSFYAVAGDVLCVVALHLQVA